MRARSALGRWTGITILLGSLVSIAPSSAATITRPRVTTQTAVVTLPPSAPSVTVALALTTGGQDGDGTTLAVSLGRIARTRSALTPLLSGGSYAGGLLATTGTFPLDCRQGGVAHLTLTLSRGALNAGGCAGANLDLSLHCATYCAGVYPLLLSVTQGARRTDLWSLLTVAPVTPTRPLALALTVTMDGGRADVAAATRLLRTLTLATSPLTVAATNNFLGVASDSPAFQRAWTSYVSRSDHHLETLLSRGSDVGALEAAGLGFDVSRTITLNHQLSRELASGARVDDDAQFVDTPTTATLNALSTTGVRRVVLPEGALTTAPSTTLHWGSTFTLRGVTTKLRVASTDDGLTQLLARHDLEPARLAALATGVLGVLYDEAPNATGTRAVLVSLNGTRCAPDVLNALLGAWRLDRLVRLTATSTALATTVVANHNPAVRTLNAAPTSPWRALDRITVRSLWIQSLSLAQALSSSTPVVHLDLARLDAEQQANRTQALAAVSRSVLKLADHFTIADDPITMSDQGTPVPLTILSHVPYLVTGVLHLTSTNATFADGAAIPISLLTGTTVLRIPVHITRGSSTLVQARFTTPNGRVTLAVATIQLRSTATSVVGWVLSGGSLAVIALWWWRTVRKKQRGRHAR